jgi:S1-C subfamily serine protease
MSIGRQDTLTARDEPAGPTRQGRWRLLVVVPAAAAVLAILVIGSPLRGPLHRQQPPLPGLTLEDLGPASGVIVTSVQSDSPAVVAGIAVGDRIVGLDQQPVASLADIRRYVGPHHPMAVDMRLARGEKPVELTYVFPNEADQ